MANPMRIRASTKDGVTTVKALIAHPMETGRRKSSEGEAIPAHFIRDVTATHGDRVVLAAVWGPAVSQNPFLYFKFQGGAPGDEVAITWTDNQGGTGTGKAKLK